MRTMAIVEFLLARIVEDEGRAELAGAASGDIWTAEPVHPDVGSYAIVGANSDGSPVSAIGDDHLWEDEGALGMDEGVAVHIAHHDPARVLAECEAKRRIVGVEDRYRARRDAPLHRRGFDGHEYIDAGGRHLTGDDAAAFIEQWYEPAPPSTTLRALAVIYSDHPDYLEAWRP